MTRICVVTDLPFYRSGDLVKGKVAIHLDDKPDSLKLELKCTGSEEASFFYDKLVAMIPIVSMTGNPPMTTIRMMPIFDLTKAEGSKSLFEMEAEQILTLRSDQTDILVPFEFQLPEELPASFTLIPDEKMKAKATGSVTYKITGRLTLKLGEESVLSEFSEDLVVGQVAGSSQTETSKAVTLFRCISQGHISCTMHLNKDHYSPGDTIALNLFLGSDKSSALFDRIQVSLTQDLTLKADNQVRQAKRTIFKYKFDGMKDVKRDLELGLPEEMESSTGGELVECVYGLRVKFKRMFGADVVFESPVQIQVRSHSESLYKSLNDYELIPLHLLVLK